jgi:hypothetical protein
VAQSILESVKNALNVPSDYDVFDEQIIMHINSVFSTLRQLGAGPDVGFDITDETATWDTFLGTDKELNAVKTYVCLRVRLLFDPPMMGYLVEALQKQIQELEWRLNVTVDTTPLPVEEPTSVSYDPWAD